MDFNFSERRRGISTNTLNPKLIRLKDEIYLQLPHPIPKCFKEFYNSREFDVFLQNGVCYIQLFLLQQKAQLAASSKAGIDQLKRAYLAQLTVIHPREAHDTTPDYLDALKKEQKEVLQTFCRCYSKILQTFGGSMNFAAERSFYERFYLALGFFFKAHIPPAEWPSVSSHLSFILQANLNASVHAALTPKKKSGHDPWNGQKPKLVGIHRSPALDLFTDAHPRTKPAPRDEKKKTFDLAKAVAEPKLGLDPRSKSTHEKDTQKEIEGDPESSHGGHPQEPAEESTNTSSIQRRFEKSHQLQTNVSIEASPEIGPTQDADLGSAAEPLTPTPFKQGILTAQPSSVSSPRKEGMGPRPSVMFTRQRLSHAPLYKMRNNFTASRREAIKFQTVDDEKMFKIFALNAQTPGLSFSNRLNLSHDRPRRESAYFV